MSGEAWEHRVLNTSAGRAHTLGLPVGLCCFVQGVEEEATRRQQPCIPDRHLLTADRGHDSLIFHAQVKAVMR